MKMYCKNCDNSFEYSPKNMKELNFIQCPRCGSLAHKDNRKKILTEKEQKADNVLYRIISILRIFYLIVGIIGIVGYLYGVNKILYVCAIVCVVLYTIERMLDINYLGFLVISILISGTIIYLKTSNIFSSVALGICIGFAISTIIRELYFLIIELIIKISNKN